MNSFMNEYDFHDVSVIGPKYTWCNNKGGSARIWERLDRCLLNSKALELVPHAATRHLARVASDHSPIVLKIFDKEVRSCKILRFEDVWISYPASVAVVQNSWSKSLGGELMDVLNRKFHRVLKALFYWSRAKLQNLLVLKDKLKQEVAELQSKEVQIFPEEAGDTMELMYKFSGKSIASLASKSAGSEYSGVDWKWLRMLRLSPRVECFWWRILKDSIPTLDFFNPSKLFSHSWHPPQPGWIKVNIDAVLLKSNEASVAGVFWDHKGRLLLAFGFKCIHWDSDFLELLAFRSLKVVFQEWRMDASGIIIEGDNYNVIKHLQSSVDKGNKLADFCANFALLAEALLARIRRSVELLINGASRVHFPQRSHIQSTQQVQAKEINEHSKDLTAEVSLSNRCQEAAKEPTSQPEHSIIHKATSVMEVLMETLNALAPRRPEAAACWFLLLPVAACWCSCAVLAFTLGYLLVSVATRGSIKQPQNTLGKPRGFTENTTGRLTKHQPKGYKNNHGKRANSSPQTATKSIGKANQQQPPNSHKKPREDHLAAATGRPKGSHGKAKRQPREGQKGSHGKAKRQPREGHQPAPNGRQTATQSQAFCILL
ncbi:hypothetical protein M5K25_011011 [Dendrobium thyrsiflorum]|uniref:RNase H type-1 domain-containing protein n=1 Tax=Dendrobium thyrsiflorum TaxID=117978 RepID=A0ABD0V1S4_DENTH